MGKVISICLLLIKILILIVLALAALVFLLYIWSSLADFIMKRIEEYNPTSKKKRNVVRIVGIVGIIMVMMILFSLAIAFFVIAFTYKNYWLYIGGVIILIVLPLVTTILLNEWWEKRTRRKYAEEVRKETKQMQEKARINREKRGEKKDDSV